MPKRVFQVLSLSSTTRTQHRVETVTLCLSNLILLFRSSLLNNTPSSDSVLRILLKTAGSNTYFRSIRKLEFDSIWKFGFECLYRQEEDARTFDEFVNNLEEATSNTEHKITLNEDYILETALNRIYYGNFYAAMQWLQRHTEEHDESFKIYGYLGISYLLLWIQQVGAGIDNFEWSDVVLEECQGYEYYKNSLFYLEKSFSIEYHDLFVFLYIQLCYTTSEREKITEVLSSYIEANPSDPNAYRYHIWYCLEKNLTHQMIFSAEKLLSIDPLADDILKILLDHYARHYAGEEFKIMGLLVNRLEYGECDMNVDLFWELLALNMKKCFDGNKQKLIRFWSSRVSLWKSLYYTSMNIPQRNIVYKCIVASFLFSKTHALDWVQQYKPLNEMDQETLAILQQYQIVD